MGRRTFLKDLFAGESDDPRAGGITLPPLIPPGDPGATMRRDIGQLPAFASSRCHSGVRVVETAVVVLKVLLATMGLGAMVALTWFVMQVVTLAREDRAYARLQDTADLEARIAGRAANYVARRKDARLVVGVWQRGRRRVLGFGTGRPEAAGTPDGQILYEIGSITKVFTGLLLARAEAEGSCALDDPIGEFLPPDVAVAAPVRAITLKQLATHTSGLPRLPDNLDDTVRDGANPYENYRAEDLHAYLRTARPRCPPRTTSEYSNLGVGLLGDLLARRAGRPFETLVRESITRPLGLPDTAVRLSDSLRLRLIRGHAPDGRPVSGWDFDVLAPAGALRSTADDLLTFLGAHLDLPDGPLGRALRRAQETHFGQGGGSRQGLGWQIEDDVTTSLTIHWHNGGTGGYKSFLGFVAGHRVGIVLLSNYGDAFGGDDVLDRMGFEILRLATKVSLSPPGNAATPKPTPGP
jgi:D-alanyl-D-alanine-carboxypeptidase/D-alanyl-D-alanine-endopeptidase